MPILVGSTGYVGSTLQLKTKFDFLFHKSNIQKIQHQSTDLLVCSGLPAQKWLANQNPMDDWLNINHLADILSTVNAESAVLISTIDVFQPPVKTNETSNTQLNGVESYGKHRAWFELFFKSNFKNYSIIRLPGLFSKDVRKNLIHDLLHQKIEEIYKVNSNSKFQFFETEKIWEIIQWTLNNQVKILNVSSEPVTAQEVASLFEVTLREEGTKVSYDMRSIYAEALGGSNGYIFSKAETLSQIRSLIKK